MELLAVLIIIGALTAIAIPVFSSSTDEASAVICKTNQYNFRVAEEAYNLMYGRHTDEYIIGSQLDDNSPMHKFFLRNESIVCPASGEHYYWALEEMGRILLFMINQRTLIVCKK